MKISAPLVHQMRDQLWVLRESQLLHNIGAKSLFFLELSVKKGFIVAEYFKTTLLCLGAPLIIKVITSEVRDLRYREDAV
jgi:hypothetical protein